jgi:hypothetical protein
MIKLLMKFAEESRELELGDAIVTIGRSSENLIALGDKKASRKHATIEKTEQGYRLNDLGSGNGTRVNGREVNTALLAKGDEIKIGLSTLYVLDVDIAPAVPAAPAPIPVAAVVSEPPSPPAAALAPAPAVSVAPSVSAETAPPPPERPASPVKITRRSTYVGERRGGGKLIATAATVLILGSGAYAAYYYWPQISGANKSKASAAAPPATAEKKGDLAAAAALREIKTKVETANPIAEPLVIEANDLASKYAAAEPAFESVALLARQKWSELISKMKFEDVEKIARAALREKRFGDATDALKPLKDGVDAARVATLQGQVDKETNDDYVSVEKWGKSLIDRKQYGTAAEHYRANAPRFRGTVHFKKLSGKAESLEELAKADAEAARAKPAETEIAKVTPKENPPEPPKEATPEPAKPEPKSPDVEKPKMPEKPKETPKMEPPKPKEPEKPKPPPPPPPPPPKPKEPEKPKEPVNTKAFKKPDVLCNCKKVVKGVYCIKCDRVLEPDDLRREVCKRCEEKPKKVDMCVKRYYMVDGKPDTISDKPFTYGGKVYDIPQEDRARIVWFCSTCEAVGDIQAEVKHKEDCASKNVIKVCTKSGIGPHQP